MLDISFAPLPRAAGAGYKPQHYSDILAGDQTVEWFEIHAESYMGAGGRPMAQLRALRERFPIAVHGVGLSIGGTDPLDRDHLERLASLLRAIEPACFSEHLAWSSHEGVHLNDLLPLPYNRATLDRVCDHVDQVQDFLGRRMLLENPAVYLDFSSSTMDEIAFLSEVAGRTGCGLLLDINNVQVSSCNHQTDAQAYITAFPHDLVGEIHLGGHDRQADDSGAPLLIDNHGAPVSDPVWQLYLQALELGGPRPTLIEWDNDIPAWPVLAAEVALAGRLLGRMGGHGTAPAPSRGRTAGLVRAGVP